MKIKLVVVYILMAIVLCSSTVAWAKTGAEILEDTGVKGGFVAHVGCDDGSLTVQLHASDSYLVQGIDVDPENVQTARQRIRETGFYGPVSADTFDGVHLPYIDNMVNLLVVDGVKLSAAEIDRVLCPRGVAYVRSGEQWKKTTKPWPDDIDEWTHYMHDPGNNAVAHDNVIGPPRRLQWVAGPRWTRHHDHMSSFSAAVSANGRIFYIIDEGPMSSILLPPKWMLIARDAFNGTVLWKRHIPEWHSSMWKLKDGPAHLPRKLVAVDDKVFVSLGKPAPLSILDAATGETIHTVEGIPDVQEIIVDGDEVFVIGDGAFLEPVPGASPSTHLKAGGAGDYGPGEIELEIKYRTATKGLDYKLHDIGKKRRVYCVDIASGRIKWSHRTAIMPLSMGVDSRGVYCHNGERVICMARKGGERVWESEAIDTRGSAKSGRSTRVGYAPTLVIYDDVVLFSGGAVDRSFGPVGKGERRGKKREADETVVAIDGKTGKTLWKAEDPASGYNSPEDILVSGGLVWLGGIFTGVGPQPWPWKFKGHDLRTGEVKKSFEPDVEAWWFHHRCHRAKATDKFLLTSRTGIEFVDTEKEKVKIHHWVRGACLYGILPCNGMIYAPPDPCACYPEAQQNGFSALAPAAPESSAFVDMPDKERLLKGPAYRKAKGGKAKVSKSDWPTYRGNNSRTGRAAGTVPVDLKPSWKTQLPGRLTPAVVAEGVLVVSSVDTHTVYALDIESGKERWRFTAGGRVDSAPTIYRGKVLFGSSDGRVYCLRASDGELVWRFLAAPTDRRTIAFEQLESSWPVPGSILVRDGLAHFVAGRSMFLDGGMRMYQLDVETGEIASKNLLGDTDPRTGENLQSHINGLNMPVALPDLLSSDDKYIYMRSQVFGADGKRTRIAPIDVAEQAGDDVRLFAPAGFVDDTWWHRTYWVYGRVFAGGHNRYYRAGVYTPSAKIMSIGENRIIGYGRKPQYYGWTTPLEHELYAVDIESLKTDLPPNARAARRRAYKPAWTRDIPFHARAMLMSGDKVFIAGPPDIVDEDKSLAEFSKESIQKELKRQAAALRGSEGALFWAVSMKDGEKVAEYELDMVPIFDGMLAADDAIYMVMHDGTVRRFSAK